jgi:hypothetical protein
VTRPDAGLALAIVMLLLLGLAIVALAGLSGATTDLAIAAADEQAALALEAAETAVSRTLRSRTPIPAGTVLWPELLPDVTVSSEIRFDPPDPDQPVWLSFPGEDVEDLSSPRYFTIRARADARRGAAVILEQGFRSLWPLEGLPCGADSCPSWPSGVVAAPSPAVELGTDPVRTSWRRLDTTAE